MTSVRLSPSSLNTFVMSPLLFYWRYIAKAEPDTEVPQVYGVAGSLVHDALERESTTKEEFQQLWNEHKLDEAVGLNGKPLNFEQYFQAVLSGYKFKKDYLVLKEEDRIEFEESDCMFVGIADVVAVTKDGKFVLVDWKTSSKAEVTKDYERQAYFYMWLCWKHRGVRPTGVDFIFIKGQEKKLQVLYEESKFEEFERFINETVGKLKTWGDNIDCYPTGDYKNIFNEHLKKCVAEEERRS